MKREDAEILLELVPGEGVSVRAVRAAFARRVKDVHPDTASGATAERPLIKDLQMARYVLLSHLTDQNKTCILCKGIGTVQARLGRKQCVVCNGTGDKFRC